jgi:hypothetical protein
MDKKRDFGIGKCAVSLPPQSRVAGEYLAAPRSDIIILFYIYYFVYI